MGYLNNTVVTVDAILTTKGRQLLAQNDGSFRITQFALADDEIDYTLYNPTQPSGSAYYGEAIINMPLLEAFPIDVNQLDLNWSTVDSYHKLSVVFAYEQWQNNTVSSLIQQVKNDLLTGAINQLTS